MSKATSNQASPEDKAKLIADMEAAKAAELGTVPPTPPTPEPVSPVVPAPVIDPPPTQDPPQDPPTPDATEVERLKAEKEAAERKFAASTREAQMLGMRDRIYQENIQKAKDLPLPSDQDMRTEYGDDWDSLDPVNQKIARESLHAKQKLALIESTNDRLTNEQTQINKVRSYTADPEVVKLFPVIEGNEDEFEKFALKPSRIGMDLEDVASLFNSYMSGKAPKPAPGVPPLFVQSQSQSVPPAAPKPGVDAGKAGLMRTRTQKDYMAALNPHSKSGVKIKPADLLK